MKKIAAILPLVFIAVVFMNNQEAQAYINPGSGSYLVQTVIGGILSIGYFFKKIFLSIFKTGKEDQ